MVMQSVDSSDLAAVGYENGTLHILFHSGGLYAYYNVPEFMYHDLLTVSSPGKYFYANIRGRYGDTPIY